MFFKNIEEWSKQKVKAFVALFGSLYLIFATVIPCVVVAYKYDIFKKASFKLTAAGIIVVIFISTVGLKFIKWFLDRLPEEERKEQIFKYTINMIIGVVKPALAIWLITLIRKNMELATDTIMYCLYSFMISIVIEHTTLDYLFNELDVFNEAKHKSRVEKKQSLYY